MKKGLALGLIALAAAIAVIAYLKTRSPALPAAEEPARVSLPADAGTQEASSLTENAQSAPAQDTATEAFVPPEAAQEENTADPLEVPAPETPAGEAEEAAPAAQEEEAAAPEPQPPAEAATGAEVDVRAAMADRMLGNPDAPVTIIEYASLTCPHCAHFATTVLADVKREIIETGRAKLIYRDFPLDRVAMKAAKLARCAPQNKYFDLIEVLFRNQSRWLESEDREKALMQYGALAGMSDGQMRACMDSAELENAILRSVSEAQGRFGVRSTPSFVLNYGAETIVGAQPVTVFDEVVRKLGAQMPQEH